MADWFQQQALSGSMVLAIPVALVAGLVSFFSPCVIPLLPGYLSYATGLSGADLADADVTRAKRGRMLAGASLFVVGFATYFVLVGAAAGTVGNWLIEYNRQLTVGLGVLSILMGLVFLGAVPFLQGDLRVHKVPAVGIAAAPLLGFLFGLGWTPCIGPTLQVIISLSALEGTVTRGAVLSGIYALGLGLPFILAAVAYERMLGAVRFVRRHQVWVMRVGGLLMIAVGVALISGWWTDLVGWLQTSVILGFEPPV